MRVLNKLLVLLLLLTACHRGTISTYANPDLTARDMDIFTEVDSIELLQYEELVDDLYYQLETRGYDIAILKKKAKLVRIFVEDDALSCPGDSPSGKCSGLSRYRDNWISYWHIHDCLGSTALPHEFVHWSKGWLHINQKDPPDGNHNDPEWFSAAGSLEIILEVNARVRCANNESLP